MTITRRSSTILAYAVGGTLFAAALYLSFELGRYRAGYAIIDAQRQAGALEELIAARDATIESLRRQEAILETSEDIDRETYTRIEATLDSRVLQIASNGIFSGTVAVDTAEIHGKLEGELTVRKQLIIHSTGKVSGKIRYAKIKVEEGAELAGEISMMERSPQAQGVLVKRTGT